MNKRLFWAGAMLLAALWQLPPAQAQIPGQATDAALVVNLAGSAQYRAADAGAGPAQPLQAFLRLRRGESVELAAEARLGVAYLVSGVVESWHGPARFKVGDIGSTFDQGTPAQTQALSRSLLDRLARAPEVLADLRNRQGLVVTREIGRPEPVAVQQARADQETAKATKAGAAGTADGAVQGLPELNLFLALYEARQYREADGVIRALAQRWPEDGMVTGLAREFDRVYRRTGP